jgi:UDP-N-acetylmuramate--alanine ligase|nr:UDP-N-acetylmuramate--L-alanine ligase [Candidatus Krumholzibacteria bacterium]
MFGNTRHIHLVAIGGIGMSGIAEVLMRQGFTVSGSDLHRSSITDRLAQLGATIQVGHHADHIAGADVVVRSSAVTEANPEVTAARARSIPVIRRAEMLAELMRLKEGIAIAGSHGKTSTTTLVAEVFGAAKLDPTVIVGGVIKSVGSNAIHGGGKYLVAEADESDGTFLHLTPTVAVVTNIDLEHVDFYPDLPALRQAFTAFLGKVPFYGTCVMCLDDPEVRALVPTLDRRTVTYGLDAGAEVRALGVQPTPQGGQTAQVEAFGEPLGKLELNMGGRHNLQNALAAVAVGLEVGIAFDDIARGLAGTAGVGRRLESHGEHDGVLVIDDYGHHPTEILATMEVACSRGRRVAVLFQPHRYSRTQRFAAEFADALAAADAVGLLPVYAASEVQPPGVGSFLIADRLKDKGLSAVDLLAGHEATSEWLNRHAPPGTLVLTLGAGDIGRQLEAICAHLDARESSR